MQVLARHFFIGALALSIAPLWAQTTVAPPQVLAPPAANVDPDFAPLPPPAPKLEPRPWNWQPLALENLPTSIRIFAGDMVNIDGQIVRAWYADIDYSDATIEAKTALSTTKLGRETSTSMAKQLGSIVAVNGGYFDMQSVPAKTYSVVVRDGQVLAKNIETAARSNGKYFLTRGAFGIMPDRTFQIRYIAHFGDQIRAYETPTANTYGKAAPAPLAENGEIWNVTQAIGGAPVLVQNGVIKITGEAEAIGRDMTDKRHPRTAIGWSGGQRLILFVSDGRQPLWSMGQTLPELAQTLFDLGCVEALNLDGGGSSTFVVNGSALNKPSDGRQRNVTSIIGIVPVVTASPAIAPQQ